MDTNFDWTRGEETTTTAPDLLLPGGVADGKSVDELDKENQFSDFPAGIHLFFVDKVEVEKDDAGQPKETLKKVFVAGIPQNIHVFNLTVHLKSTTAPPDKSIRLFLTPPPRDPQELPYYVTGTSNETAKKVGWFWSLYKHFIGHLGFDMPADGSIPPEASNPKNWLAWGDGRPRYFVGEVVEGRENPDKPLKPGQKPFNQIKFFSFTDSQDTIDRRKAGNTAWKRGTGGTNGTAGNPAQTSPAPTGAPAGAPVGGPVGGPANPAHASAGTTAGAPAGASERLASGELDI